MIIFFTFVTFWDTPMANTFWAAASKGQCSVGHRGEFPDVRPSICPQSPPCWLLEPQISTIGPDSRPPLQASNQLCRPQICPPDLKSALQASNQLSRPQIFPLGLKLSPQTSNLLLRPKICPLDLQ